MQVLLALNCCCALPRFVAWCKEQLPALIASQTISFRASTDFDGEEVER